MFSEKLVSLLGTFDRYELNRCSKFLNSPFHNEREDVLSLFGYLDQQLRKSSERLGELEKEEIWRAVYPGKRYDEAQFRRLTSELNGLLLKFRAIEAWQDDPYAQGLRLQPLLAQPALEKHLATVERQLHKTAEARKGQSAEDYWAAYSMCWNVFDRDTGTLSTTGYAQRLVPADHALDCFYLVQKLKFYVAWLFYRRYRTAPEELPVMEGFKSFAGLPRFENEPLIQMYRLASESLEHFNEESKYQEFVESIRIHGNRVSEADLRDLYQLAQNYCALKINRGHTDFYKEVFRVYQLLIDKDLLLEGGKLSEGLYKNIITSGLRVGEYKWVEHFIENYAEKLPEHIRENARTFNLANLYSHQKRYDKVIELLQNVEYSDVVYALSAKLILTRTYYESDEWDALDSLIDSFRIYLRRNKLISKTVKNQYGQFLRFVRRLIALRPGDTQGVKTLQRQIAESELLMSKKWLLEKVEELGKA